MSTSDQRRINLIAKRLVERDVTTMLSDTSFLLGLVKTLDARVLELEVDLDPA